MRVQAACAGCFPVPPGGGGALRALPHGGLRLCETGAQSPAVSKAPVEDGRFGEKRPWAAGGNAVALMDVECNIQHVNCAFFFF